MKGSAAWARIENLSFLCSCTQDGFCKGVVLSLRMKFQVDCFWICRSDKDSCGRVSLQDEAGNMLFDPL